MKLRFSLAAIFGMTTYAAVCCPMFVFPNLWWGTLIVVATIVVFGVATVQAVVTQRQFWLGFSVAGWAWLVFALGFYAQSRHVDDDSTLVAIVIRVGEFCKPLPPLNATAANSQEGFYPGNPQMEISHSLVAPLAPTWLAVPAYINLARLLACLSAILFAFVGGIALSLFRRRGDQNAKHGTSRS